MAKEYSGFWDSIAPTGTSAGDERNYDSAQITIPITHAMLMGQMKNHLTTSKTQATMPQPMQ
ncbi:hypothetical protein LJC42_01665 [Eubacteriales bacterium OttesenSCG-928-K08]|nr:hypothetical protein [Eubacteriales bacterium OttesenSCG-928-K08]